jgi:UDP-GlcNAc3NAcA epimerase
MTKIATIVGARPQFVKAAAVSRAIAEHNRMPGGVPRIVEKIVHTGQHFDANMSDVFFQELRLPKPDVFLGINSVSHGAMTGRMLEQIERVLMDDRPDWVLIYGDTNSTLAGALVASKLHIPIAHVEAGLRSYNRRMPEEINRVVADHLSDKLFCPTEGSVDNLAREGITKGVSLVGDVMLDAFLFYRTMQSQEGAHSSSALLGRLGIEPKGYCLATVHREENTDDQTTLASILEALAEISASRKPVLFPMHPRTRKKLDASGMARLSGKGLQMIDPVGYLDMIALESNAFAVITDSGGVQKEAFFSQVPCITLRKETEWVETVQSGWNVLAGTEKDRIIGAFDAITAARAQGPPPLYGNGKAARNIIGELVSNA